MDLKYNKEETKYLYPSSNKFTYKELSTSFPKGVEAGKKEEYLSLEEFSAKFGSDMTIEKFRTLKDWKKNN